MTQQSHSQVYTLREKNIEKNTCIPLFTAALFTIARTWKQPRCPSTDEQIKKLWYVYTMKYYSAIKSNAFESVLMGWMNLESIIQSEVSQKEKDKYRNLMHIWRRQWQLNPILLPCLWEYKWIQPLWKTVWRFLKKKLTVKPP